MTLANTALGFVIAWMFAHSPATGYRCWRRILFVISITIDGVDGELARLKMAETKAGARLDAITDNIVHIAIFLGIGIGSYRAAHNTGLHLCPVRACWSDSDVAQFRCIGR